MKIKDTKKCFFLVSLLLYALQLFSQDRFERTIYKDKEKVRIISYNILDGFDYLKDKDRITRFADWIKEKDPEVLALQELVGFKEADLIDLARSYGHSYAVILKENGYPVGITSKRPIQVIKKWTDGLWHGMLHVKTYGMNFIVLHLSPADWSYRLMEAQKITTYMKENGSDSYLVMGDFNSHSPFDADELETHSELIRKVAVSDAKSDKYKNMRDNGFDYATQATFLAASLEDACRLFVKADKRTTFPTRILTHWYKGEYRHERLGERLDYILLSPDLQKKCVDAYIWNGDDTDYLSDHYPVGIDILITK